MSGKAEAGWFKQDDGSQRYWDGEKWTDHTAPAASPEGEADKPVDARPLWKKKRVIIPVVFIALIILLCGIGIAASVAGSGDEPEETPIASPTPSPTPTPTPTPEAEPVAMPDVVGANLQDARDALEAAGIPLVEAEDASDEGRMVLLFSNWDVCAQEPSAGEMVSEDEAVVLFSVQEDEFCPGDEPEEPAAAEEPDEPSMSVAQQQAVRTANNYLDFTSFSRSGLIGQLEYEGYSTEDAEFAVDYVDPDWFDQAAQKAQEYLDFMGFSRAGLIDQLLYEGFTRDQAEYGVDEVGL